MCILNTMNLDSLNVDKFHVALFPRDAKMREMTAQGVKLLPTCPMQVLSL